MFDDPKKELQSLEDQLLAAEEQTKTEHTDDFQSIYAEVLAEFGPDWDTPDEPPIRNFANGYGRNIHDIPQKPVEIPGPVEIPRPMQKPLFEAPVPREHYGFLTFLFCLECLALAGVTLLWLVNLL